MKPRPVSTEEVAGQSTSRWVRLSRRTASPELVKAMNAFESLDCPAGDAATRFLTDEAIVNSAMTPDTSIDKRTARRRLHFALLGLRQAVGEIDPYAWPAYED